MAFSHSPTIITSGLVLCVDAGNEKSYPSSGTAWNSLTGINNGTLTNGPTFNSDKYGSIVFDGLNDLVTCGTFSVQFLTVSTWVYKTSSTSNQGICRKQLAWAISQFNGTLQVAPGSNFQFYNTSYVIPLNTWTHITYTYRGSGSSQIVYINGQSIYSSTAGSGALPTNANIVRLGFDDNGWYWGGRISQTQIYNRALSAQEVLQNFNATRSRYGI